METSSREDTYTTLFHWHNFKLKIVFEGIIIGILTGFIIALLRFGVDKSSYFLSFAYSMVRSKSWLIPIWIVFLIVTGYIIGLIIKMQPVIRGSGIPQVEGVILRKLDMNWWKVILGKLTGTILAIGTGLSLGIEGPSVQIGAAVGQGFSKIFKRLKIEEKYLITSGASAGIAAAFNAPLAGTMFVLEEVHKNLSPIIMVPAFSAALSSDFVSSEIFGLKPVFDFRNISIVPLNYYMFIIVLGVILGVSGVVFNKALLESQDIFSKQKWLPIELRPVFCLCISIFAGFLLPQILGEGNVLILSLTKGNMSIKILLILLIGKFIFSMICCSSGTPGGIFLPLFTIAALIGAIYGSLLNQIFNISSIYIGSFVILAMAGYFSSIIRAPMTGTILVLEMTGSFGNLLPAAVISIISYLTAYILKSKPIYQALLEKFLINNGEVNIETNNNGKSIIEIPVCLGSELEGKKVRQIQWPPHCLIVGIKRGQKEIIPKGSNVIYSGDYLIVLANENEAADISDTLINMGKAIVMQK